MITDKPQTNTIVYPYVPDATFDAEAEAMSYLYKWIQIVGQHVTGNPAIIKVEFSDRPSRGSVGNLKYKRNRVTGEITIVKIIINRWFIRANLRNPKFWRHIIAHECAHLKYQDHGFLWEMTMLHYCSRDDAKDSTVWRTDVPKKAARYVCKCPCGREHKRQTAPKAGATFRCICGTRGLTFKPV